MLYFAAVRIILTVVHICTTVLHNGRHERAATQVKHMRLTITTTLRKLMFQFIIKRRNRHSGK